MFNIVKLIYYKILGSHKVALKNGLHEGVGVSIMGGVNFGSEPYLITLDDYVRLSYGVSLITHDGGTWAFRDLPEYEDVIKYGKIKIGERTFVGAHSIIMPGVTIGKRCVIAAGSIVTKDVPDGLVVGGIPAKKIMTTIEYAEKCKLQLNPYDKQEYNENKKKFLSTWLK